MTSGVFSYTNDPAFFANALTRPADGLSFEDIMDIVRRNEPNFAPGNTTFNDYSNSNFWMLSHIIEVVTRKPWPTYIQKALLTPLGLKDTRFPTSVGITKPSPKGYFPYPFGSDNATSVADLTAINATTAGPAGGMTSTLGDLHKWVAAFASGYGLDAKLNAERFKKNRHENPPDERVKGVRFDYGLACIVANGYIGHDGQVQGFSSIMVTNPVKKITVIAVLNNALASDLTTIAKLVQVVDPEGMPVEA